MGLTAGVLGLGPFLQVLGHSTSTGHPRLFLPFALFRSIPGVSTFRVPGRISIVAVLAVDLLAAGALTALLHRWPERSRLLLTAAALLTAVELLPGAVPISSAVIPPALPPDRSRR